MPDRQEKLRVSGISPNRPSRSYIQISCLLLALVIEQVKVLTHSKGETIGLSLLTS